MTIFESKGEKGNADKKAKSSLNEKKRGFPRFFDVQVAPARHNLYRLQN